jgi:hypothetical protein
MENSMRAIEEYGDLFVDASAIGKESVRQRLLKSIKKLGYEYRGFDQFQRYFERSRRLPERLLVLGDLNNIVKQYRLQGHHRWVASVRDSKPYFLALVRTKQDEH